jgi:hypothetical protein
VGDALSRALAELVGHLAADGLHTRLDTDLGDPGTHRSQTDHADALNLGRHARQRNG